MHYQPYSCRPCGIKRASPAALLPLAGLGAYPAGAPVSSIPPLVMIAYSITLPALALPGRYAAGAISLFNHVSAISALASRALLPRSLLSLRVQAGGAAWAGVLAVRVRCRPCVINYA